MVVPGAKTKAFWTNGPSGYSSAIANSVAMTVFRNHLRGVRMPFVNPHTGHTGEYGAQPAG